MQVELYAGDAPYVGLQVGGMQTFVPFRHTLELYTKSPDHDMWSFEDMDEDEFTPAMRQINDWDWILALDRQYKHGTMIRCINETCHGNRFSIHSKKNYRNIDCNLDLDVSIDIGETGPTHFREVSAALNRIQDVFPDRFIRTENVPIRPEGRVSVYTMNCLKYTHVR